MANDEDGLGPIGRCLSVIVGKVVRCHGRLLLEVLVIMTLRGRGGGGRKIKRENRLNSLTNTPLNGSNYIHTRRRLYKGHTH